MKSEFCNNFYTLEEAVKFIHSLQDNKNLKFEKLIKTERLSKPYLVYYYTELY